MINVLRRIRDRLEGLSDAAVHRAIWAKLIFGTFGRFMNRQRSPFLLSYRPDFDYDYGRFKEFEAIRRNWIKGNSVNNLGDLNRLYALWSNARNVVAEGVEGNFAELGVYKGNSAALLARVAREYGRTTYLLDTFSGFDPGDVANASKHVARAFSDTSLDGVREFVGTDKVEYIIGRFPDSVGHRLDTEKFALVHIDCDLYEPMKAGLEFFYERASRGAIFILHDYDSGHWPGIKNATDEFLLNKPELLVLIPDKSGTAIFRKF